MGLLGKNIKFWGTVGIVATAMKLKDRWDDYRQVPMHDPEEALGAGPVALQSPSEDTPPPTYNDMVLDTGIPAITRSRRKRAKDCCVCCGINCAIFWKAFGIVCLLALAYQSFRLARWVMSKPKDGLYGMPTFGHSLACADAPYVFPQDAYSVPIGGDADHLVEIRGDAVGTIILAAGSPSATDIEYTLNLRAEDKTLLDSVSIDVPTPEDIQQGIASSHLKFDTPAVGSSCMRFDIVMRVPPSLKALTIVSHSIAQVEFATDNSIALDRLHVSLLDAHSNLNLLLPHGEVHAQDLALAMASGYMVGEISIAEKAALSTQRGDTLMFITATPVAHTDKGRAPVPAVLTTLTGKGRTDIYYEDPYGTYHRPISSTHRSRGGDLYLHYGDAGFNGHVDLKAKSYTTSGVFGQFNRTEDKLPTAGEGTGEDLVVAQSRSGWIGLYF